MDNCNNCGKEIQSDFKICPYCGKEISYGITDDVPKNGITLEFGYSSSQTFDLAIKNASKFNSFRKFGEGKKSIYRVNVASDEIEKLSDLLEDLKGWRSRFVYVDGEKVRWDVVFNYSYCFNRKKESFKPELYCFGYDDRNLNIWGCIQSQLNFEEYSELFSYGEWINDEGDWKFDKEKIRHYLEKNLFQFRFCPALNYTFVNEVVDAFPDIINPNKDKNWKFVEDYDNEEGLKIAINRYGEEEIVFMKGIAPKKRKDILQQINDRLRLKFPEKIIT